MKELEDHSWFSGRFRQYQAAYIGSVAKWFKLYQPLIPALQEIIDTTKTGIIQDLCSGSGMPAIDMHHQLKNITATILSDKFPIESFTNNTEISFLQTPVDVLELDPQPGACYTMYNAFHHFSVQEQQELIKKMAWAQSSFLIAEILTPGFFTMLKIIFTAIILQIFTAPFVHPFSLLRLFFTYIIPVNLFTVTYDGVISVMRSVSAERYKNILSHFSVNDFTISVGEYKSWKGRIIYIKGSRV